ncbi:hypothetical protein MMC14_009878 [Varicellaria rhodocarpa]|nr:hypothetical protein [Varicellaria rhodocarpa]
MRHILWDSPKWLKRRHAEPADSDSNEDDEEQFGIHEGPADDGEQTDVQDEEEGDVYPLYGEDDSDYGESSSEVTSKLAFGSALMDCQLYLVLWNFGNQETDRVSNGTRPTVCARFHTAWKTSPPCPAHLKILEAWGVLGLHK